MIKKMKLILFYLRRGIHTFFSYWSKYKITPKPSVMYFEMTYRCTCKCKFCDRWKVGPKMAKDELTTEQIKKTLKEAFNLGVRYIGFTGGEPLLKKDIFEIASFAKKIGMTTTVASNGTLINEDNINLIVKSFNSVAISMDGISAKTHDKLRGVEGVFTKASKAIDLLKENAVPVTVNMVINKENFEEIDQYYQHFLQKQISVQFTPVHDCDVNFLKVNDKRILQIDMKKFNNVWNSLADKYPLFKNEYYRKVPQFLSSPSKLKNEYTCFAGSTMFFVSPYGDVYPCEFLRTKMGNVKEESLQKIWNKSGSLRKMISSQKRTCVCWSHCSVPLNKRLTKYICLKVNN